MNTVAIRPGQAILHTELIYDLTIHFKHHLQRKILANRSRRKFLEYFLAQVEREFYVGKVSIFSAVSVTKVSISWFIKEAICVAEATPYTLIYDLN